MSAKRSNSTTKKNEPEETYETGDIVLGKLRGFPFWPSRVVDPDNVPKQVAKERPSSRKTVAYAVRFFPTGDYAWLSAPDLKRLTVDECEKYIAANETSNEGTKGKKELLDGYKACLDPDGWQKEHDSAPPPKKGGKKKKAESEEEEEEAIAEDDDDDDDDASAGKKRKRTPKKSISKKKGGRTKKSKETVESEDDAADEDAEPKERPIKKTKSEKAEVVNPKLESDPEALKVREWRHRLQKMFLSNKAMPKEEEMPAIDELFTAVEQYDGMNIDYLTFSKIGKVMRHINLLDDEKVPRNAEFRFRERANALVERWHQILNANKGAAPDSADAKAELNGNADGDAEGDLTMLDESQV